MGSVAMGPRDARVDARSAGVRGGAFGGREEPTLCDHWCLFQTEGAWLGQLGVETLAGPRSADSREAYVRASQSVEVAVLEAFECGALTAGRARSMRGAIERHRALVLARGVSAAAVVEADAALREAFSPPQALRARVEALAGVAPWPSRVAPSLPWSRSVAAAW